MYLINSPKVVNVLLLIKEALITNDASVKTLNICSLEKVCFTELETCRLEVKSVIHLSQKGAT